MFVPTFGRWEDREHTENFFAAQPMPLFVAGADWTADDNADVDLQEYYREAKGREWDSLNQNPYGHCVGYGNAKAATLAMAVKKIGGPDVAIEPVYGGMRYEIGKLKHNSQLFRQGDGGVGAWAAELLTTKWFLLKQRYGNHDLTNMDKERCVRWGNQGVPDEIEPKDGINIFSQATLAQTAEDVWRLLGQLYCPVHCSNQGFTMDRDKNGFSRPQGQWAHCAIWIARLTLKGGRRVLVYDNSWGDYLHESCTVPLESGKTFTLNATQFLVELDMVDRMCRAGKETFCLAGPQGFVEQRPLWYI